MQYHQHKTDFRLFSVSLGYVSWQVLKFWAFFSHTLLQNKFFLKEQSVSLKRRVLSFCLSPIISWNMIGCEIKRTEGVLYTQAFLRINCFPSKIFKQIYIAHCLFFKPKKPYNKLDLYIIKEKLFWINTNPMQYWYRLDSTRLWKEQTVLISNICTWTSVEVLYTTAAGGGETTRRTQISTAVSFRTELHNSSLTNRFRNTSGLLPATLPNI